ncbi:DUF5693 family protein [Paenibacillus sp. Marseille-Q4541]|uniref:DUF5693 family protein n=1 Tax=Paenibacillus sp. Marseille-Q4541 TaxID=2831522 RepID=UPI001BA93E93
MRQKWQYWNTVSRKWLWIIVIIGLIASIPVIYDRVKTESTSKTVELVFDYRDLVDVAAYQVHPKDYINEKLTELKNAGVSTMAMFESTLDEFRKSRRIMIYNSLDVANMTGKVLPENENFTYLLFTSEENEKALSPLIQDTFRRLDIPVKPWTYEDKQGLILETPVENANLKPMAPDPITMSDLVDRGFNIMPRLGDALPYDEQSVAQLMETFEQFGVKRILFDGDKVKGYNDNEELRSLSSFAELMNQHGIGLAAIENLKKPQNGFSTLSYLTDYNVVRLYSLSESDANLDIEVISDRFTLATKDRNIRMLYLNAAPARSSLKATITDPLENLINALGEEGKAVERMEANGFQIGQAEPFKVHETPGQRYYKAVAVAGSVAMIALMISYFIPILTLPAFVLGMLGSAGLYVLRPSLMEQGLALLVAISAPTIAMVLAVRRINAVQLRTPDLTVKNRVTQALFLFVRTSLLSLLAVPFMIALLNNITYALVIEQFRGVGLLHLAPIALVAFYVLFYRKALSMAFVRKMLKEPITLLWVVAAGIIGVVGYYYLSRTGNSGSVTPLEMAIRTFLEDTFGVRPRNKEFLLGHPLFIVGAFIALKYRNAIYILIIATIAQLSMVDTFAHIHTPVHLSLIRGLLGLGLGLIVGLIAIVVWQVLEGCWKKWSPLLRR